MSNVLEMIGQTPLIRLDKIAKSEGLQCDLCKCIIMLYSVCVSVCLCVPVGVCMCLCVSVCLWPVSVSVCCVNSH